MPYDVEIVTKPVPSKSIRIVIEEWKELKEYLEENKNYSSIYVKKLEKKKDDK